MPSPAFLARSTLLVMAATLASTVLGFGREVINARFYGTGLDLDAFLAAATIPTILFGIFSGALISTLVPVFSEYVVAGDEEEVRRLVSTVFNAVLIGLTLLGALGWFLAPYYVPILAHGFAPPELAETIVIAQWLMPTVVFTSLAGVASATLNAHQRFGAAGLQGIAVNVATIATVVVLAPRWGIYALVLGTALGFAMQFLVQLPAIVRSGVYRPILDLHHPGLRKIYEMLGAIAIGSAAGQTALFFDRYFASTLTPGYISGMNYASKLVGFPQQIFAAAIATVIFPYFASQFASDRSSIKHSLLMGLRIVNLVTIPSVFGLIILGRPIVAALFQRGAFGPTATDLCAGLLPYAAFGLVGLAACVVLTRCCFACKETHWTVAIAVFTVILNVVLSVSWLPTLGARGLLMANGVSQWIQAALLFALAFRLVGGLNWRVIADSALRILLCSFVMTGVLHWIATLDVHVGTALAARAWYLAGQLVIGALVFIGAARVLGVEELGIVARLILQKFERRVPSPSESSEAPIA